MPSADVPPEIETRDRSVSADGVVWEIRSEGRARVRSGGSPVPLLQLVFRSEDGTELEALAVGRTLEDLTEHVLLEALEGARPYTPDREPAPFFEGTRQGGKRGRG